MQFYQKSTILNSFCFSSTSLYLRHCCWARKMQKMAAKITWKGCACLENLQLSDTGMPSGPSDGHLRPVTLGRADFFTMICW